MIPASRNWLWAGNLLVGLTGLLLIWVKTFYQAPESLDPFELSGMVHPWQGLTLKLHYWFAPILVIAIGMVWHAHAWMHWRAGVKSGLVSGLVLLVLAAPMIVSGYAIPTASGTLREIWIWIHLISGLAWLVIFGLHVFMRRPVA